MLEGWEMIQKIRENIGYVYVIVDKKNYVMILY